MRLTILMLCVIVAPSTASGQNLIQNPGFETGTIPTISDQVHFATGWSRNCGKSWQSNAPQGTPGTPDLFDSRSPHCAYKIPTNIWGVRNVRAGGFRYVGFTGTLNVHGPQFYGETVEGTLTRPLVACDYQVSLWASATDGKRDYCNTPISAMTPDPLYNKIEVVLRKGNDCSHGKVV